MNRKVISTTLLVLAPILVLVFAGMLCKDYFVNYPYGSAPFWLYALENAIDYLLPAALCLTVGLVLRRKKD